jgi:hypothetical protein
MDEIVLRAMKKWPNVPRVYGWLRLDRRGQWLVKSRSGGFDRIGNVALTEFIGRNYAGDESGCWFFQNGPQRVFVALDYAPWVYRLNDRGEGFVTHTARPVTRLDGLYLDEKGSLLARTEAGVGLLVDRDLPAVLERLQGENAALAEEEALLQLASGPQPARLQLFGAAVPFSAVRSDEVPARFGFVPRPLPAAGEPEC